MDKGAVFPFDSLTKKQHEINLHVLMEEQCG